MIEPNEQIPESADNEQFAADKLSFVDRHAIHPLIFAFASLVFVFLLYQVGGGVLTYLITGATSITRANVWTMRWLTLTGQLCFILIPTFLLARLFATRLREVFQFRVPGLRESTLALLALFSLQRVFEAYMFFQERVPMPEILREIVEPIKKMFEELTKVLVRADSPIELLAVILVVAVVPAIVEELLFRGLIQKIFERLMSPVVSAVLAGTIFGLYHLNPFEIVPLVGLGVFFGLLRYRSQSLLVPIAAHFFNNLMAVLASYYGIQDDNLMAAAQMTSSVPIMIFDLIGFGLLFFLTFVLYLRLTHDSSRRIHS
ncbi:MAG: CPBP family intramembrane metalloprotease [Ignavibacteriales bacterium]|nr:CPBP family intramembrane metalloprotease [Ignavibacteriales bacterium]